MNTQMFSLAGRHAVVTGGASGIGQAVAQLFSRQGAIVHIVDLKPGDIERGYPCDVSVQSEVDRVFATI
ncbi:MAG: SDR family NAD(P)-dependent oxidoreductase, partial [bacterium]